MTTRPKEPIGTYAGHSNDGKEAARRFEETCNNDPFPDIPASLLNSADIDDYCRATGMVFPFRPDALKTASYPVRLGEEFIYWDGKSTVPKKRTLQVGEEISIPPNSIVFVSTEEEFRLPNYIAIRFNLHIEMVHKGLLLGTGPLVDPGFCGNLLIPLHNLTTNTYHLQRGTDFVWVEFTKTSPNSKWVNGLGDLKNDYGLMGTFKEFPSRKRFLRSIDYLNRARQGNEKGHFAYETIRSSIPTAIKEAQQEAASANSQAEAANIEARKAKDAANDAKDYLDSARARVFGFGLFGAIAVIIAAVSIYVDISSFTMNAIKINSDVPERIDEFDTQLAVNASSLNDLTSSLDRLRKGLVNVESTVLVQGENMNGTIARLESKIDELEARLVEIERAENED